MEEGISPCKFYRLLRKSASRIFLKFTKCSNLNNPMVSVKINKDLLVFLGWKNSYFCIWNWTMHRIVRNWLTYTHKCINKCITLEFLNFLVSNQHTFNASIYIKTNFTISFCIISFGNFLPKPLNSMVILLLDQPLRYLILSRWSYIPEVSERKSVHLTK